MAPTMSEPAAAFSRFVHPHWRRLHLVARRYAASDHDARDLVQETALRAWADFSANDARGYSGSWLYVILRNVAAEWARQARRRVTLVPYDQQELTSLSAIDPGEPSAPLPAFSEADFREFLDAKIVSAFDSLEPAFREVVLLSVAGELTYREIAEVLDCPIGTVMSRMARARCALRQRLAEFARTRDRSTEAAQ